MSEVNWWAYRQCTTCKVNTGVACKSLSGKVVNGHPDGCETTLALPHKTRRLRVVRDTGRWHTSKQVADAIRAEAGRRAADADA